MQLRLKEESGPIIRFIDFKEHRIEYFSGKFIWQILLHVILLAK